MTPCQVWSCLTYPLPPYSVFAAETLRYAVTLTFDPVTLTFDLWQKHLQRIVCDVMKVCTKFERNRTIRGGVIVISVFDLMTLNNKCCARLWDNIHKVWLSTTYPCRNYSVFHANASCHAVTLTFDPLTLKDCSTSRDTWSKSVRNLSEIEQSAAELLIILRIFAHVVMLWPWPVTSWPWTFTALRVSCV